MLTVADMRKLPAKLMAFAEGPADPVVKKKVHEISQQLGEMFNDELINRRVRPGLLQDEEILSEDVAEELAFLNLLIDRFSEISASLERLMEQKCEKCKSENVARDPKKRGRRSGNWWYESWVCRDCGHEFEVHEEIR